MMSHRSLIVAAATLALALALGCAAMSQQKAQGVRSDDAQFHNLKVLPNNISRDELVNIMRNWSRSLGVRCDHCHAAAPAGSTEHLDFASDAKPEKNVARAMVNMTQTINANYVSKVAEHGTSVTCYTCHRGKVVPESTLPPMPAPNAAPAPAPGR